MSDDSTHNDSKLLVEIWKKFLQEKETPMGSIGRTISSTEPTRSFRDWVKKYRHVYDPGNIKEPKQQQSGEKKPQKTDTPDLPKDDYKKRINQFRVLFFKSLKSAKNKERVIEKLDALWETFTDDEVQEIKDYIASQDLDPNQKEWFNRHILRESKS